MDYQIRSENHEPEIIKIRGEVCVMKIVDSSEKDKWNQLARRSSNFNLMQSYEWGEFKHDLGCEVQRIAIAKKKEFIAGVQVLFYPIFRGFYNLAYIPRGPLANSEDTEELNHLFPKIHQLAKNKRSIFLKIEPTWKYSERNIQTLINLGFIRSRRTNQPQASIVLDISSDPETVLRQMNKSTRKNIHLAQRQGVQVRKGDQSDLSIFYSLIKLTANRAKFPVRNFDYYKSEWNTFSKNNQACLLLAEYNGKVIASRMVFKLGSKAAEFHAGSSDEYRKIRANHLLVWESILWSKSQGCNSYDLWGIPDEISELTYKNESIPVNQSNGLWGVYNFKRGFGGDIVTFCGAYDYIYSEILYKTLFDRIFGGYSIDDILSSVIS